VEINPGAAREARTTGAEVVEDSILEFKSRQSWDLVLIAGVLIHIDPDRLDEVYDLLYSATSRYICLAEYYSRVSIEVPYRGHRNRLFKRDFAGEILDR
jgi:formaldehyde-activating enzyme involved in methanogenesis